MTLSPASPPAESQERDDEVARRLLQEIGALASSGLAPADYFQRFLGRLVDGLSLLAGALWLRTPEGHLQARAQLHIQRLPCEQSASGRRLRQEFIRQAFQHGRTVGRRPQDWLKHPAADDAADVLFVPIVLQRQVVGLIELWQTPAVGGDAPAWPVALLEQLAQLAAAFLRGLLPQERQAARALWVRLEKFAQEVHSSLDPTEVAYIVANEARQLIDCDRLSVGVRLGKKIRIAAVSGVDVIDQRSNLLRLMRELITRVVTWGERLVYTGVRDESLPADVLESLDRYLEECPARVLAVLPLRPVRPGGEQSPVASALVLEAFEAVAAVEPLLARLEVVGRHAGSALANAGAYRSIPMRFLWRPIARLQEGLGGKTRALLLLSAGVVAIVVFSLCFVSYPLKLDARGQLLPEERHWIYSPVEGQVLRFEEGVRPGAHVIENQALVLLYDVKLEMTITGLTSEIAAAQQAIDALLRQENGSASESERLRLSAERRQKEFLRDRKTRELAALKERTGADEAKPGTFWLRSPCAGTVLNSDFRETLTHRSIKPSEPLLRIGDKSKSWEVELSIPQQHVGHIVDAFRTAASEELDIDLKLLSCPTRVFRGKLARNRLAAQAGVSHDDPANPGSVLVGSVRLDGPGIASEEQIPRDLLLSGTEIRARIRCGDRPLGYCLFYGLWEFVDEKVLFWF